MCKRSNSSLGKPFLQILQIYLPPLAELDDELEVEVVALVDVTEPLMMIGGGGCEELLVVADFNSPTPAEA